MEGRQPGLSIVLATQQLSALDSEVLSQCDKVIAHRITVKVDLDALNALSQDCMKMEFKEYMRKVKEPATTTTVREYRDSSCAEEEIEFLRNNEFFTGTPNQLFDDSTDPDHPRAYTEKALSENRDLTAKAIKCTDRLRPTEAQKKLRGLCKISVEPFSLLFAKTPISARA